MHFNITLYRNLYKLTLFFSKYNLLDIGTVDIPIFFILSILYYVGSLKYIFVYIVSQVYKMQLYIYIYLIKR